MNNTNNHSNNGKDILKGQSQGNEQKVNNPKPVNRIKKTDNSLDSRVHPVEAKKNPITVNKNPNKGSKNAPKGQVIQLGDKEGKIHPVRSEIKKPNRPASSAIGEKKTYSDNSSTLRSSTAFPHTKIIEKENSKFPSNIVIILLVVAIVFFVAWAVIFFYYNRGGNVHMLLGLAVICGIISLIGRKRS